MNDNELIAQFMKLDRHPDNQRAYWVEDQDCYLTFDNLQFHTSWNQLMSVVEKIQSPEIKKNKIIREAADVSIYYKNCHIEYTDDDLSYDLHPDGVQGETKIEAVHKAVVEFIKWYNSQNNLT